MKNNVLNHVSVDCSLPLSVDLLVVRVLYQFCISKDIEIPVNTTMATSLQELVCYVLDKTKEEIAAYKDFQYYGAKTWEILKEKNSELKKIVEMTSEEFEKYEDNIEIVF
ncbi:hypothetical protein XF24_00775 [candidate division SR1 bacterium Aalborg_AAW-1]|nr:hypothetical protein XF24_00775 [candidate division SR1 bacterium Aalborg_AAW-1]